MLDFEATDEHVDVHGDTAVATYHFRVQFELDGVTHDETGHEMLVFARMSDGWRVIWRTQIRGTQTEGSTRASLR